MTLRIQGRTTSSDWSFMRHEACHSPGCPRMSLCLNGSPRTLTTNEAQKKATFKKRRQSVQYFCLCVRCFFFLLASMLFFLLSACDCLFVVRFSFYSKLLHPLRFSSLLSLFLYHYPFFFLRTAVLFYFF